MRERDGMASFPSVAPRTLIALLVCFYSAWTIRVVLLMPIEAGIDSFWFRQIISQFARIALWGVPVFVLLRRIHRVSVLGALKLDRIPKGHAALVAAGLSCAWLAITAWFGVYVEGKSLVFFAHPTLLQWLGIAVTVVWAPIFEEILFRGYVYQALRSRLPWPSAALASGVLFAVAHWPGWLYLQGLHAGLLQQTVAIAIIGFVLAVVFERGQSLWPCILLHTFNNLLWAGPVGI